MNSISQGSFAPTELSISLHEKATKMRLVDIPLPTGSIGVKVKPKAKTADEKPNLAKAFPWIVKFGKQCAGEIGTKDISSLENLMTTYIKHVTPCVAECYLRPNRASKLKRCINNALLFFHMLYTDIKKPLEHSSYLAKMSDLMAFYIDMEIKASRRQKENVKKIASKLTTSLLLFLDRSQDHILDAILKTKFMVKSFAEISTLILSRVLRDSPGRFIYDMTYVRYILVFKLWTKLVKGSDEKRKILKSAAAKIFPPPQFREKLKAGYLNGVLPKIPKARGDVTTFLLQAKFCVKEKTKAYLQVLADPKLNCVLGPNLPVDLDRPLLFEMGRDSPSDSNEDQNDFGGTSLLMDDVWSSMSLETGLRDQMRLADVTPVKPRVKGKGLAKCKGIATPIMKLEDDDSEKTLKKKKKKQQRVLPRVRDQSQPVSDGTEPGPKSAVEASSSTSSTTDTLPTSVICKVTNFSNKMDDVPKSPIPASPSDNLLLSEQDGSKGETNVTQIEADVVSPIRPCKPEVVSIIKPFKAEAVSIIKPCKTEAVSKNPCNTEIAPPKPREKPPIGVGKLFLSTIEGASRDGNRKMNEEALGLCIGDCEVPNCEFKQRPEILFRDELSKDVYPSPPPEPVKPSTVEKAVNGSADLKIHSVQYARPPTQSFESRPVFPKQTSDHSVVHIISTGDRPAKVKTPQIESEKTENEGFDGKIEHCEKELAKVKNVAVVKPAAEVVKDIVEEPASLTLRLKERKSVTKVAREIICGENPVIPDSPESPPPSPILVHTQEMEPPRKKSREFKSKEKYEMIPVKLTERFSPVVEDRTVEKEQVMKDTTEQIPRKITKDRKRKGSETSNHSECESGKAPVEHFNGVQSRRRSKEFTRKSEEEIVLKCKTRSKDRSRREPSRSSYVDKENDVHVPQPDHKVISDESELETDLLEHDPNSDELREKAEPSRHRDSRSKAETLVTQKHKPETSAEHLFKEKKSAPVVADPRNKSNKPKPESKAKNTHKEPVLEERGAVKDYFLAENKKVEEKKSSKTFQNISHHEERHSYAKRESETQEDGKIHRKESKVRIVPIVKPSERKYESQLKRESMKRPKKAEPCAEKKIRRDPKPVLKEKANSAVVTRKSCKIATTEKKSSPRCRRKYSSETADESGEEKVSKRSTRKRSIEVSNESDVEPSAKKVANEVVSGTEDVNGLERNEPEETSNEEPAAMDKESAPSPLPESEADVNPPTVFGYGEPTQSEWSPPAFNTNFVQNSVSECVNGFLAQTEFMDLSIEPSINEPDPAGRCSAEPVDDGKPVDLGCKDRGLFPVWVNPTGLPQAENNQGRGASFTANSVSPESRVVMNTESGGVLANMTGGTTLDKESTGGSYYYIEDAGYHNQDLINHMLIALQEQGQHEVNSVPRKNSEPSSSTLSWAPNVISESSGPNLPSPVFEPQEAGDLWRGAEGADTEDMRALESSPLFLSIDPGGDMFGLVD